MSPTLTSTAPRSETPFSCGGCEQVRPLSRRGFLRGVGVATAAAAAAPAMSVTAAYAADAAVPYTGDVLVVVSLRGGMDGLSLVAPVGDPDYALARPTLAVPTSRALPTGDRMFGLHPALAPLAPLWASGLLGAVHAVGTPDTSRSHFAATEELERAAPGTTLRTGWLDRVLATRATGSTFQAVQLGGGTPSSMFTGSSPEFAAASLKGFSLAGANWVGPRMAATIGALQEGVSAPSVTAARLTIDALASVEAVVKGDRSTFRGYPASPLGGALADVAKLVRAGRGLQAAAVDEGDWDMHAGLGAGGTGRFADKASDLAKSLAAFAADLGPLMANVTLVTISEFGRRVAENASGGTDHGHGNCMLVMGGGTVGGKVHGRWPGLAPAALDRGDLADTTDYRSVIGEILVRRTGVSTSALASVFPGWTPEFLGLARGR